MKRSYKKWEMEDTCYVVAFSAMGTKKLRCDEDFLNNGSQRKVHGKSWKLKDEKRGIVKWKRAKKANC